MTRYPYTNTITPETSYEFIKEWFEKARDAARRQGRKDSAALWSDGLQHLEHFRAEIERKDKALLLAARWFKLNFDDDTLSDHPPSKADLAGMFDVMQEARLK